MPKRYDNQSDGDAYYTILHTMVGAPKDVLEDPRLSLNLEAHFFLQGDVVPASLLGPQVDRLVKLGALRLATVEESGSGAVRTASRRQGSEEDAADAASLGTRVVPSGTPSGATGAPAAGAGA
jgi:hypothetical protein